MKKDIVVNLDDASGATPIAKLVQVANSFESSIYLTKEGVKVNAKSIMGMMNLVLTNGSTINIEATGNDEKDAVEALERFLLNFGE